MEPTPPLTLLLPSYSVLSIGVYVFLAALMLETYALLAVAVACFAAAFAPALMLVRRH